MQEISHLEAELRKVQSLRDDWEQRQSQQYISQGKDLQLADSQVQEYNRLKQQVAIETAGIQARLDDQEREYREAKDSYDAMVRHKNDIVSSYKRKETELSENQKRLSKLEEYITSSRQQIHDQRQLSERLTDEINQANERLEKVQQELAEIDRQLGDASVERTESSRAQRKRELIENLKRLFPSVSGRLLEMCEPSHRKYQVAITKVS
jgi:structural maintenance of chromosome 1